MPTHTCAWPDLEATIKKIEKTERVLQVVDAPNRVVIITEKKPRTRPKVETRG